MTQEPINCAFLQKSICELGYFKGKPHPFNCKYCILNKENTLEAKAKFEQTMKNAHPPEARRVSGCCDSALNY